MKFFKNGFKLLKDTLSIVDLDSNTLDSLNKTGRHKGICLTNNPKILLLYRAITLVSVRERQSVDSTLKEYMKKDKEMVLTFCNLPYYKLCSTGVDGIDMLGNFR